MVFEEDGLDVLRLGRDRIIEEDGLFLVVEEDGLFLVIEEDGLEEDSRAVVGDDERGELGTRTTRGMRWPAGEEAPMRVGPVTRQG